MRPPRKRSKPSGPTHEKACGEGADQIAAQEAAVASTGRVAQTTRRRHELGDASLADVLDAERELADQQAGLAASRANAASDMVTLYKALGGGWEVTTMR